MVIAQTHNPTILHPAFLAKEGIVPVDWPLASDPVCTPPLAQVAYQNGVSFVAQPSRLAIKLEDQDEATAVQIAASLTVAYLRKLPYVPYRGIGLNISSFLEMDDPQQILLNRFVAHGILDSETKEHLMATEVSLQYEISSAKVTVKCEAIEAKSWPSWSNLAMEFDISSTFTKILNN